MNGNGTYKGREKIMCVAIAMVTLTIFVIAWFTFWWFTNSEETRQTEHYGQEEAYQDG